MSTLADHIDRLASTVKSIRTAASAISDSSSGAEGPFTRAVLHTPLGNLIRDVDASELGLFTLVTPSHQEKQPKEELARVEFHGATPLRRPAAARKDDALRVKEFEPEVYAQAALKYLDRYQSIRPMPRARSQVEAIMDQLATTRARIQELNQKISEKGHPVAVPSSPKSQANAEERRIQELQTKIAQIRKQKESLLKSKPRSRLSHPKPPVKPSQPSTPQTPTTPSIEEGSSIDSKEEAFWQTPAESARVLHFTDTMLMDEEPDLADVSVGDILTLSFDSPMKPESAESSFDADLDDAAELEAETETESESFINDAPTQEDDGFFNEGEHKGEDEDDDENDKTIVIPKQPPAASPPAEPIIHAVAPSVGLETETPARIPQSKMLINHEMERIVARIWSTVSEIIMPGHPFDTSGAAGSSKPPRAKETVAHLRSLSSQSPSPASPSSASLSSISALNPPSGQPTTQQILTAHLLVTLLESPPTFSMPLNRIKDVLASKAKGGGDNPATNVFGRQDATKALYACVAKKLVKIERGDREQIVKFDI